MLSKIKNLSEFEEFKLSKSEESFLIGGRTVDFESVGGGNCAKVVDSNSGTIRKIKTKDRYAGRC